ncbi:hypothetical protein SASPL_145475 [Salvia splendens]|uniref:BED-type domain-containing protein n=1 Tax=Salvia splendens TaxID=180675 RepID=A0A8X8WIY7_SALSN|nr:hypothetical protein SASPL_145475 [Salvia splendens]
METSESLTQDVGSNRPDLDILEDIEIEELGLGEKGEGKGMASKNGNSSKKRKHVERSDVWAEFDKVIVDSVQKGKCKRCDSLIAADPKLNGTSAMWKHHASCLKKHEAGKNQTTLSQDDSGALLTHCIDKEWRLHKKIISFFDISSHKGDDLAEVLIKALTNWGIQRLFCCTMDNARSNDVAIRQMKSTFNARNMLVANGQYFHQRCVAHIINLVVDDGLKQIGMAVVRVREAVKWIKGSSARSKSFKDIAKVCKVDTKKFFCQDVPTRWNSTYLMLEAALPYEPAMKLFNSVTPQFGSDLRQLKHKDLTIGVPGEEDWIEVKRRCGFLQKFYDLTRLVSGTTYVTSHSFFMEMCDIFTIIKSLEDDREDADIRYMAKKMMEKLGKYWLEEYELNPNMNKILYIAAMFDPRQKMKHVQYCLKMVYGDTRANVHYDSQAASGDGGATDQQLITARAAANGETAARSAVLTAAAVRDGDNSGSVRFGNNYICCSNGSIGAVDGEQYRRTRQRRRSGICRRQRLGESATAAASSR